MEIGTSSRVPITPFVVQPIIKPISPFRARKGLKIIPLNVQTFTIHVLVTIVVSQHVEGNERFDKE